MLRITHTYANANATASGVSGWSGARRLADKDGARGALTCWYFSWEAKQRSIVRRPVRMLVLPAPHTRPRRVTRVGRGALRSQRPVHVGCLGSYMQPEEFFIQPHQSSSKVLVIFQPSTS
jgi:hypothetical protein